MTPLNSLAEAAQKLYDGGHVALAARCVTACDEAVDAWRRAAA